MTTPQTLPQQPLPGGGDGYGLISGAALRRDPYKVLTSVVNGEAVFVDVTTVHQLNTAKATPSIYLPQMDVTPGDKWRFSFRTRVELVAAAGDPTVRMNAEWYNAAGTMIHEDSSPFVTFTEAGVTVVPGYSVWTPTLEATVPANAASVHIVAEMKCVNPVNAWSIFQPSYVKI